MAAAAPLLLLTCGDPAGIGPEVVALAWEQAEPHRGARLRVIADADMLAQVLDRRRGLPAATVAAVTLADLRASRPGELLVVAPSQITAPGSPSTGGEHLAAIEDGVVSAAGGQAAGAAVVAAAQAVLAGDAAAIVTGPLNKAALNAAGYDVPGHTELLARACGLPDDAASMMLWLPGAAGRTPLGVVHATLHESLRSALGRLSVEGIAAAGRRLAAGLTPLLGRSPRLVVAALNPHGGEGGLFGDEESRLVEPAVAQLAADGLDVSGPLPADTLFAKAFAGAFDGVVALYHDQGHIPVKLLGMHRAVNITLGLPIVRTSVAHGTAFDIVGRGLADPASLLAAIDAAKRIVAAGGV